MNTADGFMGMDPRSCRLIASVFLAIFMGIFAGLVGSDAYGAKGQLVGLATGALLGVALGQAFGVFFAGLMATSLIALPGMAIFWAVAHSLVDRSVDRQAPTIRGTELVEKAMGGVIDCAAVQASKDDFRALGFKRDHVARLAICSNPKLISLEKTIARRLSEQAPGDQTASVIKAIGNEREKLLDCTSESCMFSAYAEMNKVSSL